VYRISNIDLIWPTYSFLSYILFDHYIPSSTYVPYAGGSYLSYIFQDHYTLSAVPSSFTGTCFYHLNTGSYHPAVLIPFIMAYCYLFYNLYNNLIEWRILLVLENLQGNHTLKVQKNFKYGFALFIVSEVMFFFGFFIALFYYALSPTIEMGNTWPSYPIITESKGIPTLNTLILLCSGVVATWGHKSLIAGYTYDAYLSFIWTIYLALFFMMAQLYEYTVNVITLQDGVYGSVFYMLTGFHGFHVFVGIIMLRNQILTYKW